MLIGVSHRRGGLDRLERWKLAAAEPWLRRLDGLGLTERVLLDTCNRWDMVINAEAADLAALRAPVAETTLAYTYRGEAALEQLIRVTAALDSLNPGESQITAQVRRAYANASVTGALGKPLHFAFQTALRAAKRVRRELDLTTGESSLFSLAKPHLATALREGDTVAVLGAGEMGAAAARSVARGGAHRLLVVNRTPERAAALAQTIGATALPLDGFLAAPPPVAALVCTLGGGATLDAAVLTGIPGLKLIVDLGAPRNVAPAAVPPGVRYVQLSDLVAAGAERRAKLARKLARAEQIVTAEAAAAMEEWTERQLAETIARVRTHYRARVAEALPGQEAEALASRLARPQIAGLRALARRYGLVAAEAFIEEAGI